MILEPFTFGAVGQRIDIAKYLWHTCPDLFVNDILVILKQYDQNTWSQFFIEFGSAKLMEYLPIEMLTNFALSTTGVEVGNLAVRKLVEMCGRDHQVSLQGEKMPTVIYF